MASNKHRLQEMLASTTPAPTPSIQRGAPYQVGAAPQAEAFVLAPQAAALPEALQEIARRYLDARRRSGEALLDAARWLSEARSAAEHGEWYLFLDATGTSQDTADRLLNVHRLALENVQFADAVRRNWLGQSVAALLAAPSTPAEVVAEVLAAEEQPSARTVRRRIRAARGDDSKSRNVAGFEGADDTVFGEVVGAIETLVTHPDLVSTSRGAWPLLQRGVVAFTTIRRTLVAQLVAVSFVPSGAPYRVDAETEPVSFADLVGMFAGGRLTSVRLYSTQATQGELDEVVLLLQVVDGLFDEVVVVYAGCAYRYALTTPAPTASQVAEQLRLGAPQAVLAAALLRDLVVVRELLEQRLENH